MASREKETCSASDEATCVSGDTTHDGDIRKLSDAARDMFVALWALGAASEESDAPSRAYYCYSGADSFAAASSSFRFLSLPQPESFRRAPQAQPLSEESEEAAATGDDGAARIRAIQGTCFFMRVGYWTYEVCPFKRVRQYHSETSKEGTSVHSEFVVGTYDASKDDWRASQLLYTQQFTMGDEGRSATVRIICPENRRDEDGLVIVHEPSVKHYVITLRVAAICTPAEGAAKPAAAAAAAANARAAAAAAAAAAAGMPQARAAEKMDMLAMPRSMPSAPLAEIATPQARLLSPIRGRCFQIVKDYWTYEYCPMKHVRQFHVEAHWLTSNPNPILTPTLY